MRGVWLGLAAVLSACSLVIDVGGCGKDGVLCAPPDAAAPDLSVVDGARPVDAARPPHDAQRDAEGRPRDATPDAAPPRDAVPDAAPPHDAALPDAALPDAALPDAAPPCRDTDGDGYGDHCPAGPDCDDGRADVHPGAAEVCDGVDQNCDGRVDEDARAPCYSGPPDTLGHGVCVGGTRACAAATCEGEVLPAPTGRDPCDNGDEDCDGRVDEDCFCHHGETSDCYGGPAGTQGVGVCRAGRARCIQDHVGPCDGQVLPAPEECNGRDDDCDGQVDEGVTNACGGCGPVGDEVCNGRDDDCDGQVDEGVTNACGQCGDVPPEVCNGHDDDCDGQVDEGVQNACGQCGDVAPEACNGQDDDCDGLVDEGVQNACGGCGPVPDEVCDGEDDDCDGRVDEDVTNACGQCGDVPPEICDGNDNDCDGLIDEDGICDVGCVPQAEVCNNADDDCDGLVDEGIDLFSNISNCGSCGHRCPPRRSDACIEGECRCGTDPQCDFGETCDGSCYSGIPR
jgi:hypothetical protein